MSPSSGKEFDIIVFGATSFVGEILCEYLVQAYGSDPSLKWAMAARSQSKIDALKNKLGQASEAIPVFIADSFDITSMQQFVTKTRVVISTIGPYALYGEPLVKLCAETGTDYCDLTGEVQWTSRMLIKYEDTAKESGAHIVNSCGFDSIPSDLGVHFLQAQAKSKWGHYCDNVKASVKSISGGISGGTIASGFNAMKEAASDKVARRAMANPYATCPPNAQKNPNQKDMFKPKYDPDFNSWLAPFIMATTNSRVVLRSNALRGMVDGSKFLYEETAMTGSGIKAAIKAQSISTGIIAAAAAASLTPIRKLLINYVLPKPGEGPSPEEQLKGFFDIRYIGKTEDGKTIYTKVTGDRDPGYGSTAKMLAETAICMAKDFEGESPEPGFPTPASMMGDKLLKRLTENAGLTFEVLKADA